MESGPGHGLRTRPDLFAGRGRPASRPPRPRPVESLPHGCGFDGSVGVRCQPHSPESARGRPDPRRHAAIAGKPRRLRPQHPGAGAHPRFGAGIRAHRPERSRGRVLQAPVSAGPPDHRDRRAGLRPRRNHARGTAASGTPAPHRHAGRRSRRARPRRERCQPRRRGCRVCRSDRGPYRRGAPR